MGRAHPSLKPVAYALFFFREKFFSPSSHRVVLVHPALIGALIKLPDCNLYRLTNNLTPEPQSQLALNSWTSIYGSGLKLDPRIQKPGWFRDLQFISGLRRGHLRNLYHSFSGLYPQSHLCTLGSSLRGVICNYKPTQD